MKKYFVYLFLCTFFSSLSLMAQETAIKFESGLSWQEVQAKAKTEHKLIFVDCYATWCGPCKWMDEEIFTKPNVVNYFNTHFINVKLQMDKTPKDGASARSAYPMADSLSRLYKISAYPTYLFFSADGMVVHKLVGTTRSDADYIAKAEAALDPNMQYFKLMAEWQKHAQDSVYLYHAVIAARNAGEDEQASAIANSYVKSLHNPVTKSNVELLWPLISSEANDGFQLYLRNAGKINELEGTQGFVEDKLSGIIFREEVAPILVQKNAVINWPAVSGGLQAKYTTLDKTLFAVALQGSLQSFIGKEIKESVNGKNLQPEEWKRMSMSLAKRFKGYDCGSILLGTETRYYFDRKNWAACANATIARIDKYKGQLEPKIINDLIWNCVFLHATDKGILNRALKHMADLINIAPDDLSDIDTYANLLYKTGHTQKAIEWENKVIDTAAKQNRDAADFKSNLKKMQQGKPTWGVAL